MTDYEKEADRIIEMFLNCFDNRYKPACDYDYSAGFEPLTDEDNKSQSEVCSLLYVQGIIDSNPTYIDFDETGDGVEQWVVCNKQFYEKVKEIIQNK